jgi:hypothetical protein
MKIILLSFVFTGFLESGLFKELRAKKIKNFSDPWKHAGVVKRGAPDGRRLIVDGPGDPVRRHGAILDKISGFGKIMSPSYGIIQAGRAPIVGTAGLE